MISWNKKETYFYQPTLSPLSHQSCWNCGRKASETCSGCNTARYCGSFCQHKDWEKHHHVCGQGLQGLPGGSSVPLGTPSSSVSSSAPPTHSESTPPGPLSLAGQSSIAGGAGSGSGSVSASPKESSSSSASRSTTPATPALLDATSRWCLTLDPFHAYWCDSAHTPHKTKLRNLHRTRLPFLFPLCQSLFPSYLKLFWKSSHYLMIDWFAQLVSFPPKYLFCLSLFHNHSHKYKDSCLGFSVV